MSTIQKSKTEQETETKTQITTEQSQKLIQTMLTMSFGCFAFLRGLFPDETFVDQRFVPEKVERNYNKQTTPQNNSIKIKTLVRGKSKTVDLLLDWLEKGVFQSIKLKYLNALSVGIFLDENNPTDLVENYTFSFHYDQENNVKLRINGSEDTVSLLDSRKMAQQLMRRFIIITQSLEPLPQKKFISMRLLFNDNTDPKYQPPLFKDATFCRRATLKIPNTIDQESFSVGTLDTSHHKVDLQILSVPDFSIKAQKNPDFKKVDPFDLIDDNPKDMKTNESTQVSNLLSDLLQSSQPSIQPTQAIKFSDSVHNIVPEIGCECRIACPTSATVIKVCKICKKSVHGVCYGNSPHPRIDSCLACLFAGEDLDTQSSQFKDLMMLRRCYRFIVRHRRFPSSISEFKKCIVARDQINEEITRRILFCITVLFNDNILSLTKKCERSTTQTGKVNSSLVLVDEPGLTILGNGDLKQGQRINWYFKYTTSEMHRCYSEVIATSKSQFQNWLYEIRELRRKYDEQSLFSSCQIQNLNIMDSATQDSIIVGKKRNHLDLEQYLKEGDSSVMKDTIDIASGIEHDLPAISQHHDDLIETSKKIRKISVSKKTLKSIW
ncbi:Hop1p NDAI_0A02390 [Naumovozyma dairenensis CBS 421]|uniref:HORMA domain-containing protein n=1 Tax=Naumovozyma dairenensis (strain ATCC 10597 / BCRC 20456 / CBS 421 / NBRC 0211 / NRRL Y-12639) TaxID=1071378 RepID=G0W3K9_NAUDC|nr:hypothetical protein NDAI_0A02390 [Naumovozyma dairenensis CBS 421]CCD22397.1 hypothetical protein NDAI_0A02390 [Naumovozyma dairenensis CBS 421]